MLAPVLLPPSASYYCVTPLLLVLSMGALMTAPASPPCRHIPAKSLHSAYMEFGQQKARRVRPG